MYQITDLEFKALDALRRDYHAAFTLLPAYICHAYYRRVYELAHA